MIYFAFHLGEGAGVVNFSKGFKDQVGDLNAVVGVESTRCDGGGADTNTGGDAGRLGVIGDHVLVDDDADLFEFLFDL